MAPPLIDPRRVVKSIKVKFDHSAKIAAALTEMATTRVMAGVPAEKGIRKPEDGEKSAPINNAALMYIHEFGDAAGNLPARPVVYPAIKSIRKEVQQGLRGIALMALEGKPEAVERGFHALGLLAQNALRKRITDGPFVPLKPATIAARYRQRGQKRMNKSERKYFDLLAAGAGLGEAQAGSGVRPLINSGQLRRALTYVIRKIGWGSR